MNENDGSSEEENNFDWEAAAAQINCQCAILTFSTELDRSFPSSKAKVGPFRSRSFCTEMRSTALLTSTVCNVKRVQNLNMLESEH